METRKEVKIDLEVEDLCKAFGIVGSFDGYWGSVKLVKKDGTSTDIIRLVVQGVKNSSNTDSSFQLDIPETKNDYSIGEIVKVYSSDGKNLLTYGVYLEKEADLQHKVCYFDTESRGYKIGTFPSVLYCTEEELKDFGIL